MDDKPHLGPGYYELPDPWKRNLLPVCGTVRPTSSFAKSYKKDIRRNDTVCGAVRPTSGFVKSYKKHIRRNITGDSSQEIGDYFIFHNKRQSSVDRKDEKLKILMKSRLSSRLSTISSPETRSPTQNLTHPSSTWGGASFAHTNISWEREWAEIRPDT